MKKYILQENNFVYFYNKIYEYIINIYLNRIKRMRKEDKPHFCICNFNTIFPEAIYTEEQLSILEQFENVHILRGCEHCEPYESAMTFYKTYKTLFNNQCQANL